MRPTAAPIAAATLCLLLPSSAASAEDTDAAAIEAAIVAAYVDGIHRNQDVEAIRVGLHEKFVMSILRDGEVAQVTRDEWIDRIEKRKADRAEETERPEIGYDFTLLDRSGDAAVARIDIHRDGEHIYTDYMSLYRFEDGWKIVGKIFQSHG